MSVAQSTVEPGQPNVLLIVLDDMGFNDLGANGNSDSPTPNLDAIAASGTRYTRHYADTVCSPARVALLTGQFPERFGFRPVHLGLSADTPTIANSLGAAGYHTKHIGKWHVGNATMDQSPQHAGFHEWTGVLHQRELDGNNIDVHNPGKPTYKDPHLRTNFGPLEKREGHLTEILTDEAIDYLASRKDNDQPWFLNLWYLAPHVPLQPAEPYARKYPDNNAGKYLALLEQVDAAIGRLMGELERLELQEETFVIVLSDNGAVSRNRDSNLPFNGHKSGFTEGSFRTPLILRWPGRVTPGTVSGELVAIQDVFPTVANAAHAIVPGDLVGRDLLGGELTPRTLFWEWPDSSSFSLLSKDGRWRLTKTPFTKDPLLFDLDKDHTGFFDVAADHPDVVAQLVAEYANLHNAQRQVDYTYRPLAGNGMAILTGNDMLRSPGYTDFTFAIAVSPGKGNDSQEMIAHQAGRWTLRLNDNNKLRLRVSKEVHVNGPELPEGECSEVVVSTRFSYSLRHPKRNNIHALLYVNGELEEEFHFKRPELDTWGYTNPTYIGVRSDGKKRFHGELGKPVILSERLVPEDQANELGLNAVSSLPALCGKGG